MSKTDDRSIHPKSIRHKQILDVAADDPDASFADIANDVPSATAELVERVLDTYGDPADDADSPAEADATDEPTSTDDPDAADDPTSTENPDDPGDPNDPDDPPADDVADGHDESTESSQSGHPSLDDLSERERTTLRAVYERPNATQSKIADVIGVSRVTVSNRVRGIEGFDWSERASFVEAVFGDEPPADGEAQTTGDERMLVTDGASSVGDSLDSEPTEDPEPAVEADETAASGNVTAADVSALEDAVEQLSNQVDAVERRLAELDRQPPAAPVDDADSAFTDPDLTHKVVHACMASENVSEDEELRIIRELVR